MNTIPLLVTKEALEGKTPIGQMAAHQVVSLVASGVSWELLPSDLRSDFALAYYCGQVMNGGHAQFVGNSYLFYNAGPERMLQWAAEAAENYRLPETLTVIRKVEAWVVANPDEAIRQTGFDDGIAKELPPLDRELYAADLVGEAEWRVEEDKLDPNWVVGERAAGAKRGGPRFPIPVVYLRQAAMLLARPHRLVRSKDYDDTLRRMSTAVQGKKIGTSASSVRRFFRRIVGSR